MWKVDNFEDENLRNKTESNDKNRQKLEIQFFENENFHRLIRKLRQKNSQTLEFISFRNQTLNLGDDKKSQPNFSFKIDCKSN